jgi:hypothetical protein
MIQAFDFSSRQVVSRCSALLSFLSNVGSTFQADTQRDWGRLGRTALNEFAQLFYRRRLVLSRCGLMAEVWGSYLEPMGTMRKGRHLLGQISRKPRKGAIHVTKGVPQW